jgi:hypothetical protein
MAKKYIIVITMENGEERRTETPLEKSKAQEIADRFQLSFPTKKYRIEEK